MKYTNQSGIFRGFAVKVYICVIPCMLPTVFQFSFLPLDQLFKLPLEKEGQVGGPILAQEEIKTIFGSIPDIYEVHTRIRVSVGTLVIIRLLAMVGLRAYLCVFLHPPERSRGAAHKLVRGPQHWRCHLKLCKSGRCRS